MPIHQVQVDKDRLTDARLVEIPSLDLAPGAARLAVESFALTANNVTYAVAGVDFGYWNFFPAAGDDDQRGVVPVWGHARVIESACDGLEVGERVYGYLPMASALDVVPGDLSPGGFIDTAAHRQPMSPVYNRYTRLAADPEHDATREGERMIFGPLFRTGFLIDWFMGREDWFGASQVILTSASSKTAMGLATVARGSRPALTRIGLTSPGNADFVEESGLYDKVHTYAEIGTLALRDTVVVDFAGNAEVLERLHEHFTDMVEYSCLVGATHTDAPSSFERDGKLPGAKPELFFAPDHAVAFFEEHGTAEGSQRIAAAWRTFLADVEGTVAIERRRGLAEARDSFVAMVEGGVDPSRGIVIEP